MWSAGHQSERAQRPDVEGVLGRAGDLERELKRRPSLRVLRGQPEARRGLAPDPLEVGAHGVGALVVQAVEPAGAARLGHHEARVGQQAQVARDRRARDRQLVGDLAHRALAAVQQLDDRAPVRIAEGAEGIAGGLHARQR